jgi:hypothetical protein
VTINFETNELKTLLVAQYFKLNNKKVCIKDKSKRFSFDDSFMVGGQLFDCGYHAVDIGRSEVFGNILDSLDMTWVVTPGKKFMVFNDRALPRGYTLETLSSMFSLENKHIYDDVLLSMLEGYYGSNFIKFCIEEIVPSYTQNSFWIELGLSYDQIFKNIYPWFFPNIERDNYSNISPHYHNNSISDSSVRYPAIGGFLSITKKLREILKPNIIKCNEDSSYSFCEFDKHGKLINDNNDAITVGPINYKELASRFSFAYPESKKSNFYLVSVILKSEIKFEVNEYLVGDKSYYFDRVSSPDYLEGAPLINRLQFECESFSEVSDDQLVANIKDFTKKYFDVDSFIEIDIKKVAIDRFNTNRLTEITNKIINFIESNNNKFIVSNRSFNFENLSDGIPNLIQKIEEKVNEKI